MALDKVVGRAFAFGEVFGSKGKGKVSVTVRPAKRLGNDVVYLAGTQVRCGNGLERVDVAAVLLLPQPVLDAIPAGRRQAKLLEFFIYGRVFLLLGLLFAFQLFALFCREAKLTGQFHMYAHGLAVKADDFVHHLAELV